ncbi:MAG: methylated-DNA--[protein]-cysteine S-methyltransferase, partial [Actinomycetota bacterium]|nr:methylated-DNA--[protein]-cysteine S-methyltransferase [Actinomycetota bacterium]
MSVSTARHATGTLPNVVYRNLDSPLGPLLAVATERGLVRLAFPMEDTGEVLKEISLRVSPRILDLPATASGAGRAGRLDEISRELDEYFRGRRRAFAATIDWCLTGGFTRRVLEAATAIPYGDTATYAQLAAAAASPRGARAAGSALAANPVPVVVPCHRVTR